MFYYRSLADTIGFYIKRSPLFPLIIQALDIIIKLPIYLISDFGKIGFDPLEVGSGAAAVVCFLDLRRRILILRFKGPALVWMEWHDFKICFLKENFTSFIFIPSLPKYNLQIPVNFF